MLSHDPKVPDQVIADLRRNKLDLDKEETGQADLASYLGIDIKKQPDGTLVLTQKGLIGRILEALEMTDCKPESTPAVPPPIGSSKDSPPFDHRYNYRSIIGMAMYLAGTTRPDISFAIHQLARFSADPRMAHHTGVHRLARYLKKTQTEGMHLKPSTGELTLDLWVDADFAGLWGSEDPTDPTCTRSRSGTLITLAGNPVVWQSKLQTETALSTMESEYIALSTGMRQLLFLRRIFKDIYTGFKFKNSNFNDSSFVSIIFEDNQACLKLATSNDPPRLTPRSKSIAVKYHWFRQHLGKSIKMQYIDTKEQRANILTKPLPKGPFEVERKLLMGF
jgi:hypothetical protein